jgi:hypothetical protein
MRVNSIKMNSMDSESSGISKITLNIKAGLKMAKKREREC